MDSFLDENVGSDTRLLPDLLRSLTKEKHELQEQLSGSGSAGESGNEWQRVVRDVREAVSQLEVIRDSCQEVVGNNWRSGSEGEGVALVSQEVRECASELAPQAHQLMELQHLESYLTWVGQVMKLSMLIEAQLKSGGVASKAVQHYQDLVSLSRQLEASRCAHLSEYASSSAQYWGDQLRSRVESDFSAILSDIKWPLSSSSSLSSQSLQSWDKQKKKFFGLFTLLLQLDPHCPLGEILTPHQPTIDDPLPLPLEQLVQPLRKRFRYHFMGERRTNCKEKPEWYFTQVSAWIRDHTHFLENQIQPMLRDAGIGHLEARVEFIRGLLQEVQAKLSHDLSDLVQEDVLMAHLVDELLLFNRELVLLHYPSSYPSPLAVLLGEVPFHKWVSMEKQFAVERLAQITSSPTAWRPAYESACDADETRVPESAEGFMSLIAGITERYHNLPSVRHKLVFLELQQDLLLEFHQDLVTNGERLAQSNPLVSQFCTYLNASSYIAAVLKEWGEQTLFLTLHYHTQAPSPPPSSLPTVEHPEIDTIIQLRRQDPEFAEMEGNAFSTVASAFTSLVERMEERLVNHVVAGFKTRSKKYRKERWHVLAVEKDVLGREVSLSLSELLPPLNQQLVFLREEVSALLYPSLFQKINDQIDQILFSEVILSSQFGEGGANQLNFDLTKGFLPLLSQHCDELTRRQLLERSREACKLLQLLPGSAKLLQELLVGVVKGGVTTPLDVYTAAVAALNDFGVHTLDPTEANQVLSHKIMAS